MPSYVKYHVEYEDSLGRIKFFKDKLRGGIKEFSNYDSALRVKNWYLDKGYDVVRVKSVQYDKKY